MQNSQNPLQDMRQILFGVQIFTPVLPALKAFPEATNSRTLKGQTPLILAVSRGHLTCVKHLLENGADPSIPTTSNETPLYEVCASCNARMVQLLVRSRADVNQKCSDGWTALHESVSQNSLELCGILLRHGAKVNAPNVYGVTAVFLAAQCGRVKPLRFLVMNGGDINREAKDGATALYEACKNDHEEIVEFLLSLNADANKPGKDGLLPLQIAAKNGSYGIVSKLIPVTSRTKIWRSGISPLHLAAENDEDEVLELLIRSGFDMNALLSPDHSCLYKDRRVSPLYFAVENGNQEAASMLLEAGADPNLDPLNTLLLAVRLGQVKMVTLLLDHDANVNASIPTHPTSFPACLMLSVRNLAMLKCLMDHGCDASACFRCEHGAKPHPDQGQYRAQMETHSCLQFCELVSNPSGRHWAGAIVSLLLDYVGHVKICSRLREHLENCDDWADIKEKSMLPLCLMQLCRLRIRHLLGMKRLKSIRALDLPGRLINYLNHDQQAEIHCEQA